MDPIVQIIVTILGSGALFSFLQFIIQRHDDKDEKINQLFEKLEKEIELQVTAWEEKYEALQAEIKNGLEERENTGKERFQRHEEAVNKLEEAIVQLSKNDTCQTDYIKYIGQELMGIAHHTLVSLTDHYQIRGAITLKEKATLEAIYRPYHDGLGGNGDGQAGYEYAMRLPVVTDAEAVEKDKQLQIYKYCVK